VSEFDALLQTTDADQRRQLASALVCVLSHGDPNHGQDSSLMRVLGWCLQKEAQSVGDAPSLLFSEATLHNHILSTYCQIFGNSYVQSVLILPLQGLVKLKKQVVTEPSPEGTQKLEEVAEHIVNSICHSPDECPLPLRHLVRSVYLLATETFGDEVASKSSLFFLFNQMFFPAIVSPHHYGLACDQYHHNKIPIAVIKLIQLLLHGTIPETKLSVFLTRCQKKITTFLIKLTLPASYSMKTNVHVTQIAEDIVESQKDCLHYYLYWYKDLLKKEVTDSRSPFRQMQDILSKLELIEGKPEPIDVPFLATINKEPHRKKGVPVVKKGSSGTKPMTMSQPHVKHLESLQNDHSISPTARVAYLALSEAAKIEKSSGTDGSDKSTDTKESSQSRGVLRRYESSDGSLSSISSKSSKSEDFEKRLMASLVYRQMREHQIKQSALHLQFEYFPSLDDDLWDFSRADVIERGAYFYGIPPETNRATPTTPQTPKKPKFTYSS